MSNNITLPPWIVTPDGKPFTANTEITGPLGTIQFIGTIYANSQAAAQAAQQTRAQAYYDSLTSPVADLQDHDLAPVPYSQVVARLTAAEQRIATAESAIYQLTKGFSDLLAGGKGAQDTTKQTLTSILATFGQPASVAVDLTRYSEVRIKKS